ncbi:MAG: fasciclin domain-containing protein [Paludibacteraceae bacterium]
MTIKTKIYSMLILCLLLIVSGCNNDKEEYFAEPDWLEKPIYEVLKAEGRFSSYLACVDRTLYSGQLKEGGYFTVMAPNDQAFSEFLKANSYTTISDIPQEEVNKIVAYSILQSYWLSENLGDLFTGTTGDRYQTGDGLKKQTYHYATIYKDLDNNNAWVIDQNTPSSTYSQSTYNYKYFPVFMQTYFAKSSLSPEDYTTFFPQTEYIGGQTSPTGLIGNIYNGKIVKPNYKARNGVIHEVSVVSLPLENIDKYLQKPEFAAFKSLLDFKDLSGKYIYKNYTEDITLTEKYKILRPGDGIDKVYVKSYNTSGLEPLSFSPALEAIYNGSAATTLSDGYTLFVPKNEVLTDYINKRLLKYYTSLNELPVEAITTLINTHMVNTMIWPSALKSSQVSTGEYTNGIGSSGKSFAEFGVLGNSLTSNGFIYSIDHVIKSKLFETVYTEIFLNPAYRFLDLAYNKFFQFSLREDLMKSVITGFPNTRFTLLAINDNQLKNDGMTYNPETTNFGNSLLVESNVNDRLRRLMRMHLFEGWANNSVNSTVDFSDGITEYGGWGFRNTHSGDVVRYKDNKLQATGNIEENSFVTITKGETYDNGTVYTVDKMLQYSARETSPSTRLGWNENTIWYYLNQTAMENTNVSQFVDYIRYTIKDKASDKLSGLSESNYYTFIMPNNNAITRARANGDLPNLDSLRIKYGDDTYPLAQSRIDLAAKFVRSHILEGYMLPDDRLPYLFPYNVNSPNRNIVSTAYRVNNESMRLINQRTNVVVTKNETTGAIVFTPDQVMQNGKVVITGNYGFATPAPRLMTAKLTSGNNGYRSNRIAGKAIHHEYTNYFKFQLQVP